MPSTTEAHEDPMLVLAAEILRRRGTIHLRAWGNSMLPSLWPGDLLTIQCATDEDVVPGDIVLVLRNRRFCIHRFVEKQGVQGCLSLITRGDAMPDRDPPCAASQLLGRVAVVRRGDRSFVPNRRVSPLHSALAWTLRRCDRLRTLTLRIHAARQRVGPMRAERFSALGAKSAIPSSDPYRMFHQ
jgi:signal peptidase I